MLTYERSLNHQTYNYLLECEGRGMNLSSLQKMFGLAKLDARSLGRNMERFGMADKIMVDHNKQRIQMWVLKWKRYIWFPCMSILHVFCIW